MNLLDIIGPICGIESHRHAGPAQAIG